MKKGYLIKKTKISLRNGEVVVVYIGKKWFDKKNPNACEKWSKKCYVYNRLRKNMYEWDGIGYQYIDLFNYYSYITGYFTHIDILEVKYE